MTFDTLQLFLVSLVRDITEKTTIWQKQNAPKPKKPYLAIRLFGFREIGQDEILLNGPTITDVIVNSHNDVTLECQWIGPGSMEGLLALRQALGKPTILDRCVAAGVCIELLNDVMDIAALLDSNEYEERAVIEFNVSFARRAIDNPGVIEKINIVTEDRTFSVEKE